MFSFNKCAAALAAGILTMATVSCGAAGFKKSRVYSEMLFDDVPQGEWYAAEVKNTYELGLMQGDGAGCFSPECGITVAEAITMASRAAAIYAGETVPEAAGEWYAPYVAYAMKKGFVKEGQFDDFERAATRAETAALFADALPDKWYGAINDIDFLPDVREGREYRDELLMLYRAGVVTGSDTYGNFRADEGITRAEAAAIINRAAIPENRLTVSLDRYSRDDAYVLVNNYTDGNSMGMNGYKEGIASGWELDNRGGSPRTKLDGGYGTLSDVSYEYGTAMIREFNNFDTGLVKLETRISVSKNNTGAYIEYQNAAGKPVYRLEVIDNAWQYLNADGSYTKLYDIGSQTTFTFEVTVDLDNDRAETWINYQNCGTLALPTAGKESNMQNFRYATTAESRAVVSCTNINIVVNYAVHDDFEWDNTEKIHDYTGDKVTASKYLRIDENGYAEKHFTPVSGKVVTSAEFILPQGESFAYSLYSGDRTVAYFSSDANNLYVNGECFYEDYVRNLWYDFYLELDTVSQTIRVKLNGIDRANVPFMNAASCIDGLRVDNFGANTVSLDNIKVYELIEHDDYVPVPVIPKGEEKYNVGINICSLWTNGCHFSWSCVTPFDDLTPVLGYYDEGVPETADWEIKYMVEHGIDFQAFCWYPGESDSPIKYTRQGSQLRYGYKNAKYSDMMKYCLIWEASGSKPKGLENFKKYFVPYMIEHYFKDPRYMTIDNRPLLYVFSATGLSNAESSGGFGSNANVKAGIDYLNEELAKIGLGNVILVASNTSPSASLKEMGFEATAAYNWGKSGYQLSVNQSGNEKRSGDADCFAIPTISIGFNNVPWTGERFPLMTFEDYRTANVWARDDFGPRTAKKHWQENLYHLSTWNEYGEGTCIMPMSDEQGFGYLDVLREVYTDEKADPSLNAVPDETQIRRITHRYPQHKHLLRKLGYLKDTSGNKTIYINGLEVTMQLPVKYAPNDELLIAFDPAVGLDYRLNAYHTWDKDRGVLTLAFCKHTVVYTVGSDTYTVDGAEKSLGFKLDTLDGLPLIPLEKLCEDVGFKYAINAAGRIDVETDMADYYRVIASRVPQQWEFDMDGDTEGWKSSAMSLDVKDGILTATSQTSSTDPTIPLTGINFPAMQYNKLVMRVRYDFTPRMSGGKEITENVKMYFATTYETSLSEKKTLKAPLTGHSSNGEWVDIVIDIENDYWDGSITQLRFDPFDAVGTMEVDYIRFIENPEYEKLKEEAGIFSIVNGNAEKPIVAFNSHNASLTIITDPLDASNHCYQTVAKGTEKAWLYSKQTVAFTDNTVYQVDYDVRVVAVGMSELPSDDATQYEVFCNFKYNDNGGAVDHIAHSNRICAKDGWVHVSFTYTVTGLKNNDGSMFTIYSNPVAAGNVGYCFDNVVVTEI